MVRIYIISSFLLGFFQLDAQNQAIESPLIRLNQELFPENYEKRLLLYIKMSDTTIYSYGRKIQPNPAVVSSLLKDIRKNKTVNSSSNLLAIYRKHEELFIQEWGVGAKYNIDSTIQMFDINCEFESTLFSLWIDSSFLNNNSEKYNYLKQHILNLYTACRNLSSFDEVKMFSNYYRTFPKKVNSALIYLQENSQMFENEIIKDLLNTDISNYSPGTGDYGFNLYYIDLPSLFLTSPNPFIDTFLINNYDNYSKMNALFWLYKILGQRSTQLSIEFYTNKMISRDTNSIVPEIQYRGFFRHGANTERIAKELIRIGENRPNETGKIIYFIKYFPSVSTRKYLRKYLNSKEFREEAIKSIEYTNRLYSMKSIN